ncbi:hypothetical protein VQ042_17175 [Aurantimonas sp. A2-1-M11]|uniref:hypothetical protein n=1 Tax=Aurantimonas sp. A2-1-M11 TaxID=3113712 RepID=UPI002F92BFE0
MKTIVLLGTTAALAFPGLSGASAQAPGQTHCVPALTDAGFSLTLRVDGQGGLFRLACRDGALVAISADEPVADATVPMAQETPDEAADQIAASAAEAQSEMAADAELAEPPAELSASPATDSAAAPADTMAAEISDEAVTDSSAVAAAGSEPGDDMVAVEPGSAETVAQPDMEPAGTDDAADSEAASDSAAAAINTLVGESGNDAALDQLPTELADPTGGSASEDAAQADSGADAQPAPDGDDTAKADGPADDVEEMIDESAEAAAEDLDADTLQSPPELSAADLDTARNAAGLSGATPETSITEAPQDAHSSGPAAMADDGDAGDDNKPAVASKDAAPIGAASRPGKAKQDDRLAATDGPTPGEPARSSEPGMVAVPLAVIGSAELALPGASFRSVAIRGDGEDRIYALRGEVRGGRDVAVTVAVDGAVLKIDREVTPDEVPKRILRIAEALMPDAEIDHVILSNRENYKSFFVFAGMDTRGERFELEIRSDGRSVAFDRPS